MARVTSDYNLAVMNPALAGQWHPTLNGDLTPRSVASFSGKRPWWLCSKGHEWQAIVNNRRRGNGCPYCAGQLVTKDNNLRVMNPGLAKQWHPTKNGSLRPEHVRPKSSKMVWWICNKGHEWMSRVSDRTIGRGCPHCPRRKAREDNCLATLAPHIASEWHPTMNGDLTPREVTKGSNKKVWWMCRKGHEWEARIGSWHRHGCPVCWREKIRKIRRKKGAGLRRSRSYE
jgi:hypothetical protein